jgi:hypothetical protein
MLLIPPSTICSLLMPSLRLRTPWANCALSARNRLAIARPAGSSPARLIR